MRWSGMIAKKFEFLAYLCVIIVIKAIVLLFAWNNSIPMMFDNVSPISFNGAICLVVIATCLFHSHRIVLIQLMMMDFYKAFLLSHTGKQPPKDNNLPPKTQKKKKFKE